MRILLIRHAEPDYTVDSLTPKGRVEAELLSRRMIRYDIRDFYVSPLGRARDTAAYTLEAMNNAIAKYSSPSGAGPSALCFPSSCTDQAKYPAFGPSRSRIYRSVNVHSRSKISFRSIWTHIIIP